jgi:hypothetical protein
MVYQNRQVVLSALAVFWRPMAKKRSRHFVSSSSTVWLSTARANRTRLRESRRDFARLAVFRIPIDAPARQALRVGELPPRSRKSPSTRALRHDKCRFFCRAVRALDKRVRRRLGPPKRSIQPKEAGSLLPFPERLGADFGERREQVVDDPPGVGSDFDRDGHTRS